MKLGSRQSPERSSLIKLPWLASSAEVSALFTFKKHLLKVEIVSMMWKASC
ncbi:hypothetical protein YC2023_112274 [Brassica napus]